jgi:Tfp pilus assembly protein PilP
MDKIKQIMDKFRILLENNKKIAVIISILVILLSTSLTIYNSSTLLSKNENHSQQSQNLEPEEEVELLPVQKRDNEVKNEDSQINTINENINTEKVKDNNVYLDPFAGPIKLNGVIVGGQGENAAIIKVGNSTYVVKKGDIVLNYWTVKTITKDFIIIESDSITHKITL